MITDMHKRHERERERERETERDRERQRASTEKILRTDRHTAVVSLSVINVICNYSKAHI